MALIIVIVVDAKKFSVNSSFINQFFFILVRVFPKRYLKSIMDENYELGRARKSDVNRSGKNRAIEKLLCAVSVCIVTTPLCN